MGFFTLPYMAGLTLYLAIGGGLLYKYLESLQLITIPDHLLGHSAVEIPELLSEQDAHNLFEVMKSIGTLNSNTNDLLYYETKHEHIGEARPIECDNETDTCACSHPFLMPSVDRTSNHTSYISYLYIIVREKNTIRIHNTP